MNTQDRALQRITRIGEDITLILAESLGKSPAFTMDINRDSDPPVRITLNDAPEVRIEGYFGVTGWRFPYFNVSVTEDQVKKAKQTITDALASHRSLSKLAYSINNRRVN